MFIGLLWAFGAALAYGIASILQSVGIHRAGAAGGTAADLVNLKTQPLYFVGLALDGVGFIAVIVALQQLPLFLVQAIVAASVGVTAVIAASMGAKIGWAGWLALGVTGVGLVMLSVSAAADEGDPLSLAWRWVLLVSAVPVGSLMLLGSRLPTRSKAAIFAFGAGLGFSVVAIGSRALQVPDPLWTLVLDPSFWAVLLAGVIAVGLFAMALQAGSVTSVSAINFTTETVLPAAVGLAFLGDSVRSGYWPLAVAGFVVAVGGAIALARYAETVPEQPVSAAPAAARGHDGSR